MQTGTVAEGMKHIKKRYASQFLSLKFPLKMKYFVLVLGFAVLPNTSLMAQPTIVLGNANWSQHRNLNSFYISSNSCLDTLASWVNTRNWDTDGKTFALTTDITTFTGIIGASLFNPFKGTFDGRNPFIPNIVHTINLNIPSNPYSSTQQYVGLFGYIYEATIRNVIVTGTVQIYQYPQGLTGYVGGIAGYAKNSRIMNCINNADISVGNDYSGAHSYAYVGGIVGCAAGAGDIVVRGCVNNSTVIARKGSVGGIIGIYAAGSQFPILATQSFIDSNINNGLVSGRNFIGGIIGQCIGHQNYEGLLIPETYISQCLNNGRLVRTGSVNYYGYLGGIVGFAENKCVIFECLNIGSLIHYSNAQVVVGGIAGYIGNNSLVNITINSGLIGGVYNIDGCIFGGLVGMIGDNASRVKNSINTGVISVNPTTANLQYSIHSLVASGVNGNVDFCYADSRMCAYGNSIVVSGMNFLLTEQMVRDGIVNDLDDAINPSVWEPAPLGSPVTDGAYYRFTFSSEYVYPMIRSLSIDVPFTMADSISKVAASPVFFGDYNFANHRNVDSNFYASNENEVDWHTIADKVEFYSVGASNYVPHTQTMPFSDISNPFYNFYNLTGNLDVAWYAKVLNRTPDTLEAGLNGLNGLNDYVYKKQIPINNPYPVFPPQPPIAELCSGIQLKPKLFQLPPNHHFKDCACICYEKCDCCKLKEECPVCKKKVADCEDEKINCLDCKDLKDIFDAELANCPVCPEVDANCAEEKENCSNCQKIEQWYNSYSRCSYCRAMSANGTVVYDCFYCQDLIDAYINLKDKCPDCINRNDNCKTIKETTCPDEGCHHKQPPICDDCDATDCIPDPPDVCDGCIARQDLQDQLPEDCKCECEAMKWKTGVCCDNKKNKDTHLKKDYYALECNFDCYTLSWCSKNTAFLQIRMTPLPYRFETLELSEQTPLEDTIMTLPFEFYSPVHHTGRPENNTRSSIEFCVPKGTKFCMDIKLWGIWFADGTTYTICDPSTPPPYKENLGEAFEFSTLFTVSEIVPSPVKDKASFTVNFTEDGFMDISVYDMSGAKIFDVLSNASVVANTERRIAINFAKLPSGVYTIMVQVGNVIVPRVFIKQ